MVPKVDATADKNRTFVQHLYQDLFGRAVDPGALARLVTTLGQGASRESTVQGVIGSDEYATLRLQDLYTRLLHRPVDPQARNSMLAFLRSGGTEEQVIAVVAASDEYFQLAGGTPVGLVDRLYADLLGRPADATGRAQLVAMLGSGTTRTTVVQLIVAGDEYARDRINAAYQKFLQRPADAPGLQLLRAVFRQGGSRAVISALVASAEYHDRK